MRRGMFQQAAKADSSYSYVILLKWVERYEMFNIVDIVFCETFAVTVSICNKKVNFRTFWYASHPSPKILRDVPANSQNWSLRGLFWLAKDLYEDKKGFKAALKPDAVRIHAIRNLLVGPWRTALKFDVRIGAIGTAFHRV